MIRHLQAQLKKVANEAERIPQLKTREAQLQATIEELKAKLRDAKSVHAPVSNPNKCVRLILFLFSKIFSLFLVFSC